MSNSTPAPAFGRRLAKAPAQDPADFTSQSQPRTSSGRSVQSDFATHSRPSPSGPAPVSPRARRSESGDAPLLGIGTRVPAALAREFRIRCTTLGITQQDAHVEAMEAWLAKNPV